MDGKRNASAKKSGRLSGSSVHCCKMCYAIVTKYPRLLLITITHSSRKSSRPTFLPSDGPSNASNYSLIRWYLWLISPESCQAANIYLVCLDVYKLQENISLIPSVWRDAFHIKPETRYCLKLHIKSEIPINSKLPINFKLHIHLTSYTNTQIYSFTHKNS